MMKFLALLGLAVAAVNPCFANEAQAIGPVLSDAQIIQLASEVSALDLINWKVGDSAEYKVSAGSFGNLGSMTKAVTKDEGSALWITQNMNLLIQKQKVEILISKADGKVLKMIVNGREQSIPDEKIEIISQDFTEITVPAGKFEAIHIVAKTTQAPKLEVWVNPRDTVMEGTLKQVINTQGMDISMELKSFKRAP